jgi:hypothetical protein
VASPENRFDWYQASVPTHHEALSAQLLATMPEGTGTAPGRGLNSFKHRLDYFTPDGEVIATLMHGGVNPHPNVKSTGDFAPALASVLRSIAPAHRVSRVDVAIDMQGEGLFDDLVRIMRSVGTDFRLRGEKIIPDDLDEGSTYYLGARSAPTRVRCYEKGKQLFKLTGDPVWKQFFGWARLELQVRPEKGFKSAAASLSPEAFWGCSAWTKRLSADAVALNPERVHMKPTRIADHERAMRAATSQYGQTFLRQVSKLGSWEAFLDDLKLRLGVDTDQQDAA